MIYLDNAASTPIFPEIIKLHSEFSKYFFANPNSNHPAGLKSKELYFNALNKIAKIINCDPDQIFFFNTASDALYSVISNYNGVSSHTLDHSSITNYHNSNSPLKSLNYVNHELGKIEKIPRYNPLLIDASQAPLTLDINAKKINADFLVLNSNKLHGPKNLGILIIKKPSEFPGQLKPKGTPDHIKIALFAKTLEIIEQKKTFFQNNIKKFTKYLSKNLLDTKLNYPSTTNILNFQTKSIPSEKIITELNKKDIHISNKSACRSSEKYSNILENFGLTKKENLRSFRISFGMQNTIDEIEVFTKIYNKILSQLKGKKFIKL